MRSSPGLSPMAAARDLPPPPPAPEAAASALLGPIAELARGSTVVAANASAPVDPQRVRLRSRSQRAVIGLAALSALWAVLTGGAVESWVMGAPAVLVGAALIFAHPAAPRWRLSLLGAMRFAVWFAVQSVRGAADVAGRALAWRLPLQPGCRRYRTALPEGAPRLLFANAITLLPGTLSAEIEGDLLVVHMLDTDADLGAELGALEARLAALFALPSRQGRVEGVA